MSEPALFNENWLEIQRKYWDTWMDMSRKAWGLAQGTAAEGETAAPTLPWEAALDHWWKAWAPAAPEAAQDFMGKMIEQGKVFFRMGETFVPGVSGGADGWSSFSKALDDLQSRFTQDVDEGENTFHRMMAFWELPYDNWQRMMSSLSPMPGDVLRNMPHEHVKGQIDRVLSAPGLGYTREEQSQYQDLVRRAVDYQAVLREYMGFYTRVGIKSVDRMRSHMQELITSGKTIDSARQVYDDWVRSCEEVYAEEVSTPDYARIHGHLINAQMALKHRMAIMVDESLGAMNMPTRSELRTLQDRLQESRRENKRLRHDLTALQRQVAALMGGEGPDPGQTRALPSALVTQVAPAPTRRKSGARTATPE